MPLVLSLFPGIGLLDMAFEEEGFCVVRGPDLLWGGDVHRFHPPPGRFDGVIGGPPCQAFSRLRHMVAANGFAVAPNLIPEFERIVDEAAPRWFVMENVEAAPLPRQAIGSAMVRDFDCGGLTDRRRRFSWAGLVIDLPQVTAAPAPFPAVTGPGRVKLGGSGKVKATMGLIAPDFAESCRRQGLPEDFDLPAFLAGAKQKAIGNGVPLPMGRAIAKAVKRAIDAQEAA